MFCVAEKEGIVNSEIRQINTWSLRAEGGRATYYTP